MTLFLATKAQYVWFQMSLKWVSTKFISAPAQYKHSLLHRDVCFYTTGGSNPECWLVNTVCKYCTHWMNNAPLWNLWPYLCPVLKLCGLGVDRRKANICDQISKVTWNTMSPLSLSATSRLSHWKRIAMERLVLRVAYLTFPLSVRMELD